MAPRATIGLVKLRADGARHVLELLCAEVAEQQRRLLVLDLRLHAADLLLDMAVGREDVRVAVEVVIEEEHAECQDQQALAPYASTSGASSTNSPLPSL